MSFMWLDLFKAGALGIVEGLTEFVPVSSTGHLLLVQRFFGFDDEGFGKTLAVLIQRGALLALLSIYFLRLSRLVGRMFSDRAGRQFVIGVLLTLLPLRSSVRSLKPSSRTCCSTPGSSAVH
jgi:undecaprenyl-diphosphatase